MRENPAPVPAPGPAPVAAPAPARVPGAAGPLRVRVLERIQETPDAVSLLLDPELPYLPGQFLTLRIPGGAARCYSLASSPHTGEPMRITVKKVPGGPGSTWVCDTVAPGDELEVLPPAGTFTPGPDGLDRDLLLVAGGSGITPVLSLAKSALAAGRGRTALLYANRDPASVIFRDELERLAARHPERLTVVHWLESLRGLPTAGRLGELVAPYSGREAWLCGPGPLMDAAEAALRAAGTPGTRIRRERYFSLGADVFADASAPAAPSPGAGDDAVAVAELDGSTRTAPWPRRTTLLDALLAAGVDAPYSCREGACAACCCRVVEGEVTMTRNEVLDGEDLADGYVLACQALPRTDRVRVTYD
ncbi:ferredoxin--NADP reductase [Streptomyces sp. NPDC006512]|uniref:ferredoxin--NADP reductase n=1 Tax=Streptomyces sp. NPDC006512 TaxID=3154307 RepID=UPI00339EA347